MADCPFRYMCLGMLEISCGDSGDKQAKKAAMTMAINACSGSECFIIFQAIRHG